MSTEEEKRLLAAATPANATPANPGAVTPVTPVDPLQSLTPPVSTPAAGPWAPPPDPPIDPFTAQRAPVVSANTEKLAAQPLPGTPATAANQTYWASEPPKPPAPADAPLTMAPAFTPPLEPSTPTTPSAAPTTAAPHGVPSSAISLDRQAEIKQREALDATKEQQGLLLGRDAEIAKYIRERQDIADKQTIQDAKDHVVGQTELDRLRLKDEAIADQMRNASIDPDRFFQSQTAASKFALGISLITGGMLQGSRGLSVNPGLQMLQTSIDQDIKAQEKGKEYLSRAGSMMENAVGMQEKNLANQQSYAANKRLVYWEKAKQEIDAKKSAYGVSIDSKGYESANKIVEQKILEEKAKLQRARETAALAFMISERNRQDVIQKHDQEQATELMKGEFNFTNDPNKAYLATKLTRNGSVPMHADGTPVDLRGDAHKERPLKKDEEDLRTRGTTLDAVKQAFDVASSNRSSTIAGKDLRPEVLSTSRKDFNDANERVVLALSGVLAGMKSDSDRDFLKQAAVVHPNDSDATIKMKYDLVASMMGPNAKKIAQDMADARHTAAGQALVSQYANRK